jgi:hypothetical protein
MTSPGPAPYRLSLVGPWELTGPDGGRVRSVLSQPKRLCLLAHLALAGRPVSRASLVSLFWPESDEERARNALSQSLHYLRRSLTKGAIESLEGDRLLVSPDLVWFDARVLLESAGPSEREALTVARRAAAGADFFEGWNADDSQPLQEWLDGVRRRVRERAQELVALGDDEDVADVTDAGGTPTHVSPADTTTTHGTPAGTIAHLDSPGTGSPSSRPDPAAGSPPPRRGRRWVGRTLAAAALVVILVIGMVRSGARAEGEALQIGVLMPQIAATDSLHPLSAEAVHAELLARLAGVDGLYVRSLPFAHSASEFRRILEAVGDVGAPDAVLVLNARVGRGEVRVVGLLLGGPDYTEAWGTSAATHTFATDADALMGLPQEIAVAVAEDLAAAGELAAGR